jgi:putative membrane protein
MFLLFLLLAVGLFLLVRRGTFGAPPPWLAGRPAPEAEAKKTLADRFARGDISAEEFMERASVLNWTPGSEQWPTPTKRKR